MPDSFRQLDTIIGSLPSPFAQLDALIASLHPTLVGTSSLQLLCVLLLSLLGARAIEGRREHA